MAYAKKVTVAARFDGQDVVAVLRPLKFPDAMAVRNATGSEEAPLAKYIELLPSYLLQLTPILDSDGDAISQDELFSSLYFTPLIASIMTEHIAQASVQNPPKPVEK